MKTYDAINVRVSTRSFDGKPFSTAEIERLKFLLDSEAAPNPFGNKVKLGLSLAGGDGKPAKMGTYGLISGAKAFAAAAVAPGEGAFEDVGWALEGFVLKATAIGLASCWIGGLFSRGAAGAAAGATGDDLVPVVIAVGKAAPHPSLAERIVRGASKARSRKPLAEIAFSTEGELTSLWLPVLEAVRAAPSASNKQPWRLVTTPDASSWALFLDEDKAYNHALGAVRIQNIDIGIAMRHFALATSEFGLPGAWSGLAACPKPILDFGASRGWGLVAVWS